MKNITLARMFVLFVKTHSFHSSTIFLQLNTKPSVQYPHNILAFALDRVTATTTKLEPGI